MKTGIGITAKTRGTGKMKTANRLFVSLLRIVQSISTSPQMSNQTPEQMDAATRRFVIRSFSVALVAILGLFGYSIVYTEQPLFNEAPADKAIFGILTLVVGQILTTLNGYLNRASGVSMPPPMPMNPCAGQIGYTPQLPMMGAMGMGSAMSSGLNLNNPTTGFATDPGVAWFPPDGPTNPPHHLEPDHEREALAAARESVK